MWNTEIVKRLASALIIQLLTLSIRLFRFRRQKASPLYKNRVLQFSFQIVDGKTMQKIKIHIHRFFLSQMAVFARTSA